MFWTFYYQEIIYLGNKRNPDILCGVCISTALNDSIKCIQDDRLVSGTGPTVTEERLDLIICPLLIASHSFPHFPNYQDTDKMKLVEMELKVQVCLIESEKSYQFY